MVITEYKTEFNMKFCLDKINESKGFDILYSVEKNTWNGNTELQLVIMDIKFK